MGKGRCLLLLVAVAALAPSALATKSFFESSGITELNKLNKDALFL